jgi:hypothetical protein
MSMREYSRTPAMKAALTALAIPAALLLWTLVRALRPSPLPPAVPAQVASADAMKRGNVRPPANVELAVENDLFAEDRSAPANPYRMPGEADPNAKPRVEPMKPFVLGTAVATDGRHFATLQLGDSGPKLVRVGDKIGEWVVKSIERGKVVLVSTEGTRAELVAPKPSI